MQLETWRRWPTRDARASGERSAPGRMLTVAGRLALALTVLLGTVRADRFTGTDAVVSLLAVLAAGGLFYLFVRSTRLHRIGWALAAAAQLLIVAGVADQVGAVVLANVIWCGLAVMALLRLPLAGALPTCAGALVSYAVATRDGFLALVATLAAWSCWATCSDWTPRPAAPPSGCCSRSGPPGRPRRRAPRWPSGPGSPGRSTTCWRTASPPSWSIWRRPG